MICNLYLVPTVFHTPYTVLMSKLFEIMLGGMEFEVNRLSKHTLEKASKAKLHLEAYYKVGIFNQRRAEPKTAHDFIAFLFPYWLTPNKFCC